MSDVCLGCRIFLTALALCATLALQAQQGQNASAEDLARLRPSPPTPVSPGELYAAIARGIDHLLKTQRGDGAWGGPQWTGGVDVDPVPGAFHSFDLAVTAMCAEALLGAPSNEQVEAAKTRALKFLTDRTFDVRRAGPGDLPHIWGHCYCIQTFSKWYEQSDDPKLRQQLSEAIGHHMRRLDRWQSVYGGWFYYGRGMSKPINPSCSFVNAAVLIAIDRARRIGIECDSAMLDKALVATKRMRKPDSSYLYSMFIPTDKIMAAQPINRPAGSLGRSQACNLALRLWGDDRITDDVIEVWLDRLITRHGWLDMGRKRPIPHESHAQVAGYFYYFGVYYGALCIDALPADKRAFYQHHLARLILDRQEPDGSWFDYPLYSYHKPYGTAFALLALERCR